MYITLLLEIQIIQKKALLRATDKLMVKEGFNDLANMEKLEEEIKQLKKGTQKDLQLLETQINQKKALERADDELMTIKGIYDLEAQKDLQENAARSTTEKIVSIVDAYLFVFTHACR